MRPVDLAREHALSAQAVRNYEEAGALPVAARSAAGHRRYTERHARALRAFLALRRAIGHAPALEIMRAVGREDLDAALTGVDRAHDRLLRDRATLAVVEQAIGELETHREGRLGRGTRVLGIGELAGRLGVSPATLRHWEAEGLISAVREQGSGHRRYPPQQAYDAELVHLLRRGGHRLADIRIVLGQMHGLGEPTSLRAALDVSRDRITARGLALLDASAELSSHLRAEQAGPLAWGGD
ncbi:MerR family DNA-binding transcriptional regulator [Brachybacterium alimentarium]|uniref:MerR family DNA-binding transcriptional regulator n=1 Tax=Brachybacterium alimentarium TaxID=47845 RepID=UPI003FD42257